MGIRSIIFDLGGVLLDIDYQATVDAFARLGHRQPEEAFTKNVQADLFRHFEMGLISQAEFIQLLKDAMPRSSETELIDAWCALLGTIPDSRVSMLVKLSKEYDLFILSNTNSIHQSRFEGYIENTYGWSSFRALFREVYYSHEIGMRKPDRRIYEHVLNANNLLPSETLFLDDTALNLISAREIGIQTIEVGAGDEVTKLLYFLLQR